MSKLYPGISPIAAQRMERIAGSYASMSEQEQQAFTQSLREARKRGAKAKAVTQRKVESDEQEANGDSGATESADNEISGDTES